LGDGGERRVSGMSTSDVVVEWESARVNVKDMAKRIAAAEAELERMRMLLPDLHAAEADAWAKVEKLRKGEE
jgi:hypothetical protein